MTNTEIAKQSIVLRKAVELFRERFSTNEFAITIALGGKHWGLYIYWGSPVWKDAGLPSFMGELKQGLDDYGISLFYGMTDKGSAVFIPGKYFVIRPNRVIENKKV